MAVEITSLEESFGALVDSLRSFNTAEENRVAAEAKLASANEALASASDIERQTGDSIASAIGTLVNSLQAIQSNLTA